MAAVTALFNRDEAVSRVLFRAHVPLISIEMTHARITTHGDSRVSFILCPRDPAKSPDVGIYFANDTRIARNFKFGTGRGILENIKSDRDVSDCCTATTEHEKYSTAFAPACEMERNTSWRENLLSLIFVGLYRW